MNALVVKVRYIQGELPFFSVNRRPICLRRGLAQGSSALVSLVTSSHEMMMIMMMIMMMMLIQFFSRFIM